MKHLESAIPGKNNVWRYALMIITVFLASNTIGAVPLLVGLFVKSMSNPQLFNSYLANPNNYSLMDFGSNTLLVMMLFPFIAGLAAFILLFRPIHSRAVMSVINGTAVMRWNRFFVSMLIWGILSVIYFLVYLKMDPENFSLANTGTTVIILAAVSLIFIPFQAALEEVLFRGYLMQGFAILTARRWMPLIITSLLFALLHGVNPEVKEYGFLTMMPQYILFGLIFGIVTIMDDGIEAAIGAHAANNIFLCIAVTNKSSALQTAALYEQMKINQWMEFAGLLVSGIIFVLALKVIFKWKDFSILFSRVERQVSSDTVN